LKKNSRKLWPRAETNVPVLKFPRQDDSRIGVIAAPPEILFAQNRPRAADKRAVLYERPRRSCHRFASEVRFRPKRTSSSGSSIFALASFVAHELYHHAEAARLDAPLGRRYRPTLFRIGNWRWDTGIVALAEIATGAFCAITSQLALPP
jgi:hypothetical protein